MRIQKSTQALRKQRLSFDENLQTSPNSLFTNSRVILALAVVTGITLRFYRLEIVSMTADEGATWAAAAAPVESLLRLQPQLDAGKLAVYDLLLHFWMNLFGDGLLAMRSFSVAADTASILLMYVVVREISLVLGGWELTRAQLAGAFAAFLFATNVEFVQSARTARMYPLMTAAALAQIFFFVRVQHEGRILNCVLTAIFLALAISVNFTAAWLLVSEGIWLTYLMAARWRSWPGVQLRVARPASALAAGIALLLPFVHAALTVSRAAVAQGALDWISYQAPLGWSYNVLRNDAGNRLLFRFLFALAFFSFWRNRRQARLVPAFLALLTVGPFMTVATLSLYGMPMMVHRYVLLAIIGFLGLAATGAVAFQSTLGRRLVFVAIVWLSVRALRHLSPFWVDWKKAVTVASAGSSSTTRIVVVPGYAVNAVRYYLSPERRALAVGVDRQCGDARILIVSPGHPVSATYMSELKACYPLLLGRATRVEIRAR